MLSLIGCTEKIFYKKIETKNYFVEGYSYINGTDKIFPNELILINKNTKDTIYKCIDCYSDFNIILEDTLLIYGGERSDTLISNNMVIRKVLVKSNKYNAPFRQKKEGSLFNFLLF